MLVNLAAVGLHASSANIIDLRLQCLTTNAASPYVHLNTAWAVQVVLRKSIVLCLISAPLCLQ